MKFWILTLAFAAFAEAANFEVKDGKSTCLMLQLNGSVTLTPDIAGEKPAIFSFENATVATSESNCTLVKLNFTKSVEVWFQFNEVKKEWSVTPLAQFIPHEVFNISGFKVAVNYTASPLHDNFNKDESYECNTPNTIKFNTTEPDANITVTASVSNFRIQSVNASQFVPGKSCEEDHSTPAPQTTTAAPTTTHEPSTLQNFSCSNYTTTKFRMIGSFSLSITYNATVAEGTQSKTVTLQVPTVPDQDYTANCSSESEESLTFDFFGNWSIEYVFQPKKGQKYYISNITITYVHDKNLPNSTNQNQNVTVHFSQADYLEASTTGYYTCMAKTSLAINQVTLHTDGFKYKAFNDKGEIAFKSGDVTECHGDEQTSSVVPIAVGACLAGLVVIVLIAYLIGRRRSRKAGYESV
ncbi:hypothetical protein BsWGS_03900 [Bradybaena similaris]